MARRQALSSWQVTAFSQQICQSLIEFISWNRIKVMHLYLPIINKNEVDTHPIIIHTRTSHMDVLIAVPKVTPGEDFLNHYLLKESTQLVTNKWGIPEPIEAAPVSVTQIDLVVVPMLAFDKAGNRIGYGKGHYDRFLSECRPDTQKIGLCYFKPVDKIEVVSTDIAMNAVVTPNGVWEF